MPRSRSPSPKRQRLSSPTYDEQYCLSQEELRAFDVFEHELSQSQRPLSPPRPSQSLANPLRRKRAQYISFALHPNEDEENRQGPTASSSEDDGMNSGEMIFEDGKAGSAENHGLEDNPFNANSRPSGFASAASLVQQAPSDSHMDDESGTANAVTPRFKGFVSALQVVADPLVDKPDHTPSSSPDAPAEPDYSDWFKPTSIPDGAVSFQSARSLRNMDNATENIDPAASASSSLPGFGSARQFSHSSEAGNIPETNETPSSMFVGFTSGLKLMKPTEVAKNWAVPSAKALERAAQKMKAWQKDIEEEPLDLSALEPTNEGPRSVPVLQTPSRPVLHSVENALSPAQVPGSPNSPTPAGRGSERQRALVLDVRKSLQTGQKPFKSPLLNHTSKLPSSSSYIGSPLNPNRLLDTPSRSRLPAAFPSSTGAITSTSATGWKASTPAPLVFSAASSSASPSKVSGMKALGLTPRRVGIGGMVGKSKFKTPFKPGLKPGEPGRVQLEQNQASQREVQRQDTVISLVGEQSSVAKPVQVKPKALAYFDLTPPIGRQTLATSGLVPQLFTPQELEAKGVNFSDLSQITPATARYYSFHPSSVVPPTVTSASFDLLNPEAALCELQERGCMLATLDWVINHWCLILWKLAGMAMLDPHSEADPATRRWCWREVVRQLVYRYERELYNTARPALRLVTTHDAPPSCPMVLCVSNVTWPDAGVDEHGEPVKKPEVEVTDGWYRLRAQLDDALERAVVKGVLRVGRKIAVSGARIVSDTKDPCEVLDAYESMSLRICGNGSHMAPWHAKLGFVQQPFVATLDSLTSDGGVVPLIDVVVTKVHPIAFLEFIEHEGGTIQEGPWDQREENRRQEHWQVRREAAESKLRYEFEKKLGVLEAHAERLERRAGSAFHPGQWDSPPDNVENWFYQLESNDNIVLLLGGLHPEDAGWLARHIHIQCAKRRQRLHDEIREELDSMCPPRDVRSFRVVIAKDAQWVKREPLRRAQITIWDILGYTFSEGGQAGAIKEGQRFKVSNCIPTTRSAWMKVAVDAEVYLTAGRGCRWMRVK
ncbi:hypothetical protein B0H21DRAFT_364507 [Amylocystis lapponica]|nr:hypothetical protein B0H21DRAFT_364507 [Amylocystis lapponica]